MKKLILIIILLTVIIPFTFSFSEESRADLNRAAAWWGEKADELQYKLGDIGRKNPDPSNPDDKNWKEYLRITAEIQKAEEKQKLYEETSKFNYFRSISRDTAQTYKPIGDFIKFTADRGVELVIAAITVNWTDLVKLSVDSILKTRIRGKIRSILGCSETVPELENWNELIQLGYDTDNDDEIQNLWIEIQYLLEQVPETIEYNDSKEDQQTTIIDNSNSSLRIPPSDEDKTIFIKYMWAFVSTLNTGTQGDRETAETELINFGNILRAKGSVFQDIMDDGEIRSTLFGFSNRRITTRISELADGSYKNPDSTSAENLDWSLGNSSGEITSNSGF